MMMMMMKIIYIKVTKYKTFEYKYLKIDNLVVKWKKNSNRSIHYILNDLIRSSMIGTLHFTDQHDRMMEWNNKCWWSIAATSDQQNDESTMMMMLYV